MSIIIFTTVFYMLWFSFIVYHIWNIFIIYYIWNNSIIGTTSKPQHIKNGNKTKTTPVFRYYLRNSTRRNNSRDQRYLNRINGYTIRINQPNKF